MKNIYKLKRWYNLEDAAKRLSITIGEEFSLKDVIHFIIDGQVRLSWFLHSKSMRLVSFCSYVVDFYPEELAMTPEEVRYFTDLTFKGRGKGIIFGVYPQGEVYQINGLYYLDLNLNGALKNWLLSFIDGNKKRFFQLNGFFVQDNNDNTWQLMKRDDEDWSKKIKDKTALTSLPKYIPDTDYPELLELVIRKEDLEEFENKFSVEEILDKKIDKREKTSLIKMIAGLLACNYSEEAIRDNQVKASEIASDLNDKGVIIDEDTVRKYLREATQYLLKNLPE